MFALVCVFTHIYRYVPHTLVYTQIRACVRACVGARVALIDACANADGLLAVEGGLAPGAHTLVSLSLDRHRSVYYFCVLTGVLTGTTTGAHLAQPRSTILDTTRIRRFPIAPQYPRVPYGSTQSTV